MPAAMILQPDVSVVPRARPQLDLSENLAPLDSPALAFARTDSARGSAPARVRAALAAASGVAEASILPANGSLELIHRLCRAAVGPGAKVAVLAPTFGEFARAAASAGASVSTLAADEADGFRWNIPAVCARLRELRPDWVFVCNPNNPTGGLLERTGVESLVEAAGPGRLILDEAYRDFVEEAWDALPLVRHGVVILRSITKLHGMVATQFGHLVADPALVARLEALEPRWNVNEFAAAAALAALRDPDHAPRVREAVRTAREALTAGLRELGFQVLPSDTNFFLVRIGDSRRVRWELLAGGILVKDGGEIGLPGYLRLSVPRPADVDRVLAAFKLLPGALGGRA